MKKSFVNTTIQKYKGVSFALLVLALLSPSVLFAQGLGSDETEMFGDTIFKEDFGQGIGIWKSFTEAQLSPLGTSAGYNGYEASFYSNPPAGLDKDFGYGDFAIVPSTDALIAVNPSTYYWVKSGMTDHTGNEMGRMFIADGATKPGVVYQRSVPQLCKNNSFEFSCWVAGINGQSGYCTNLSYAPKFQLELWTADPSYGLNEILKGKTETAQAQYMKDLPISSKVNCREGGMATLLAKYYLEVVNKGCDQSGKHTKHYTKNAFVYERVLNAENKYEIVGYKVYKSAFNGKYYCSQDGVIFYEATIVSSTDQTKMTFKRGDYVPFHENFTAIVDGIKTEKDCYGVARPVYTDGLGNYAYISNGASYKIDVKAFVFEGNTVSCPTKSTNRESTGYSLTFEMPYTYKRSTGWVTECVKWSDKCLKCNGGSVETCIEWGKQAPSGDDWKCTKNSKGKCVQWSRCSKYETRTTEPTKNKDQWECIETKKSGKSKSVCVKWQRCTKTETTDGDDVCLNTELTCVDCAEYQCSQTQKVEQFEYVTEPRTFTAEVMRNKTTNTYYVTIDNVCYSVVKGGLEDGYDAWDCGSQPECTSSAPCDCDACTPNGTPYPKVADYQLSDVFDAQIVGQTDDRWVNMVAKFKLEDQDHVFFILRNFNPNGSGNDFAVDDIVCRPYNPFGLDVNLGLNASEMACNFGLVPLISSANKSHMQEDQKAAISSYGFFFEGLTNGVWSPINKTPIYIQTVDDIIEMDLSLAEYNKYEKIRVEVLNQTSSNGKCKSISSNIIDKQVIDTSIPDINISGKDFCIIDPFTDANGDGIADEKENLVGKFTIKNNNPDYNGKPWRAKVRTSDGLIIDLIPEEIPCP